MIKLAMLLLLTQATFADTPSTELEEEISYSYPVFYDDVDPLSDGEEIVSPPKADPPKKQSKTAQHAQIGKVEVTVDVENTDFLSQCQAEWERIQDKPKNGKKSKEDKKESHSPKAKFSLDWSD